MSVNKEDISLVAKGNRGEYRRALVKSRNTILGVKDRGRRMYNRGVLEASRQKRRSLVKRGLSKTCSKACT